MKKITISILCLLSSLAFGEETKAAPTEAAEKPVSLDVAKVSEAFGHLIGKNLESMGVRFDIAKVIKGLQDASEGRTAPMTELECVQAITSVQEAAFKEISVENLKKAEEFLTKNSSVADVKVLEPGKLQFRIEKEGTGSAVDETCSPLIRYTGKFLDGTVFGASKEDEMINLDETIPGFSKGLLGMKEGEKRIVYIHPDLAFKTKDYNRHTNSLLTFEIEVIKADAPAEQPIETPPHIPKVNPEVAFPFDDSKVVR